MRTPDGRVWSSAASGYPFWRRYLDVFDHVCVIARMASAPAPPAENLKRADGEGVTFHAIPYYVGPLQYARQFFAIRTAVGRALGEADAVIMRVSSPIAHHLQTELAPDRPFGLEVVGDPYDVFAPGSLKHPLRPFLRWWLTNRLKCQCQSASAVAYVTGTTLQRRYRPRATAFSTSYSSIELGDDAFTPCPRHFLGRGGPIRLVSVGTLEVLYKGFDILIDAVSTCLKAGHEIQLMVVGDGRCRPELQARAQRAGIAPHVTFTGRLPSGEGVQRELDSADLFVLASRTEGLPRAMIEAMARGLPCIGSAVGGIPELLDPEQLVPPGDAPALANKISEVISRPDRMDRMSVVNLRKARNYHSSVLSPRRRQFFSYIRESTREWSQRRTSIGLRTELEGAKLVTSKESQ